jgi:STE24 endopeptidase
MNTLLIILISFVLIEFIFEKILDTLNDKNWSKPIPPELADIYTTEEYEKSKAYSLAKKKIAIISESLSLLIILFLLAFKGFAFIDTIASNISSNPIAIGLIFFGILYFCSEIFGIPFDFYNTFVIEEKFGFNKMTYKTYIIDKLKSYALTIIFGGGIISLLILIYSQLGDFFWILGWILMASISIFVAMFYTSLIVPLFNKLKPLDEGDLKLQINQFSEKVGFPLTNIFIIDGSKRSTKANAYFSGLGSKKTIVLYDTLLNDHSNDELLGILAHEIGHYKLKHIQKSLIIGLIQMGILFFLLGEILKSESIATALGTNSPSFHIGIIAFSILYSPISNILGILMNMLSRKNEFEADNFAKENFGADPLIKALKKLSKNNLSNLNPHPAYVFVHFSHPPLKERFRNLLLQKK